MKVFIKLENNKGEEKYQSNAFTAISMPLIISRKQHIFNKIIKIFNFMT